MCFGSRVDVLLWGEYIIGCSEKKTKGDRLRVAMFRDVWCGVVWRVHLVGCRTFLLVVVVVVY